jgi:hypothetical protein
MQKQKLVQSTKQGLDSSRVERLFFVHPIIYLIKVQY